MSSLEISPLDSSVKPRLGVGKTKPAFGQKSFPVSSVRLTKNCPLPVTNVGLREVSKHARILDTFLIHPWSDVACHELMTQTVEQLAKLVYKLHGGSYQLMSNHLHNMTSDHRVAGSSPAGCTRILPTFS
jgi:hypothetical protein